MNPFRPCTPVAVAFLGFGLLGCGRGTTDRPVASVSVNISRPRVPLGSPVEIAYRFEPAKDAAITGDYHVFVHVLGADGQQLWSDDHDPGVPDGSLPTSTWQAGHPVEYVRTHFVPVLPYVGDATVEVGLYRDSERLPLTTGEMADRANTTRAYKVATLQLVPQSENLFVIYRHGWHPMEFATDDSLQSWQWTQRSAMLSFKNPRADATFYLEFDTRPDLFPGQPQHVVVYAGEQVVAQFPASASSVTLQRIAIPGAALGTNEMADIRIDVDRSFVPANLPGGSKDTRELGIRVYHAFVESR